MGSYKWAHCRGIVRQIGIFLLLLVDMTVTEEHFESTEPSEEFNYNVALDETKQLTRSFKNAVNNIARNHTTPLPNLQYKSRAVLRSFLIRHRIIPDVLAVAPSYITDVIYSRKYVVNLGNKFDPAVLQKPPKQVFWPWHDDTLYTLLLVDADVPSRQNRGLSSRLHWLVVNIPGQYIDKGEHVVEYMGPLAPPKTGLHRYVFVVFKQYCRLEYEGKRIKTQSDKLSDDRLHFSMRDFAAKYKLRDPISVNFYLSGWPLDQYVPEVTLPTRRFHSNPTYKSFNS